MAASSSSGGRRPETLDWNLPTRGLPISILRGRAIGWTRPLPVLEPRPPPVCRRLRPVGSGACAEPQSCRRLVRRSRRRTGLDFVHFNGMSGELLLPRDHGAGRRAARLSTTTATSTSTSCRGRCSAPGKTIADALFPPRRRRSRDRLFRNDLRVSAGRHARRCASPTSPRRAASTGRGYGMGVAAGDYRQRRLGRSVPHRLRAAACCCATTATARSPTSRASGDRRIRRLGRVGGVRRLRPRRLAGPLRRQLRDLQHRRRHRLPGPDRAAATTARRTATGPSRDRLYRNRGDGTFADVTRRALTGGADGPALGVSTADFDGDGWIDIYVANDGEAEPVVAQPAGRHVQGHGAAGRRGGHRRRQRRGEHGRRRRRLRQRRRRRSVHHQLAGADATSCTSTTGGGVFEDASAASGLGPPSLPYTGFGTAWFDFDNDGWLDLLSVNGSVVDIEAQARSGRSVSAAQPNQLYPQPRRRPVRGRHRRRPGAAFASSEVGRGAAFGDIDNDGDSDVVVGNDSGPVRLLVNNVGNRESLGRPAPRRAHGDARHARRARRQSCATDGRTLWRRARSDGSYASANDPRVLVGLGDGSGPVRVRVQWPDGSGEEWAPAPTSRWTR